MRLRRPTIWPCWLQRRHHGIPVSNNAAVVLSQQFRGPHLRIGPGDGKLDSLVLADRPAEDLAAAAVGRRLLFVTKKLA